jgi:hypothetical protein
MADANHKRRYQWMLAGANEIVFVVIVYKKRDRTWGH